MELVGKVVVGEVVVCSGCPELHATVCRHLNHLDLV